MIERTRTTLAPAWKNFLSVERWARAFEGMASRRNPPGPDGESFPALTARVPQLLAYLRLSIGSGSWKPGPFLVVERKGPGGRKRTISLPNLCDKWVHRVVQEFLAPVAERVLSDACVSYRKGRGVHLAAGIVAGWLGEGPGFFLRTDIENFYSNIHTPRLVQHLVRLPVPLAFISLVRDIVTAPGIDAYGKPVRICGLPLGFSVSPVLANLYLSDVDREMEIGSGRYLRFGDDLLLLDPSMQRLEERAAHLIRALAAERLRTRPEKTRMGNVQDGFDYLGHWFKDGRVYTRSGKKPSPHPRITPEPDHAEPADSGKESSRLVASALSGLESCQGPLIRFAEELLDFSGPPPKDPTPSPLQSIGKRVFLRTLYLIRQGAVARLRNEAVEVTLGDQTDRIPLRKLDQVVVIGRVHLTTPLLQRFVKKGAPVVFLSHTGSYMGRLESLHLTRSDISLDQYRRTQDEDFRLAVARRVVNGRLQGQEDLLRSRRKSPKSVKRAARSIRTICKSVRKAGSIQQLMGLEGAAARAYYGAYAECLKPSLGFSGRNRKPPKDPVNALLSFGYTLLYNDIRAVAAAHGMDARFGFLHENRSNRPALAMDLIEELRAPVVERMVLRLVNQKVFSADAFHSPAYRPEAVYLSWESRSRFIEEYEKSMAGSFLHQSTGLKLDVRRIISIQVMCLKRVISGTLEYYLPARLRYR